MTWRTGLLMAAGGSRRMGRPKQLLPFGETTLLGASLRAARACGFDQLIVTVGGSADEVIAGVDLTGTEVVRNPDYGQGCSSSIAAALPVIDPRSGGFVLLLGDQPLIDPASVARLVEVAQDAPIGACEYRDGLGHPFWLGRQLFDRLATLHGDKGVWKLIDAAGSSLRTARVDTPVPIDVDTQEDYQRLCAAAGLEPAR